MAYFTHIQKNRVRSITNVPGFPGWPVCEAGRNVGKHENLQVFIQYGNLA